MTLAEKLKTVDSEAELTGFISQLEKEGRYDNQAKSLCELRRAEMRGVKGWR